MPTAESILGNIGAPARPAGSSGGASFAITPHDTNKLARPVRGIFVGGAGNVTLVTPAGDTVAFNGLAAGQVLDQEAVIVKATGTTATALVGME